MAITAADIAKLRKTTGAGMMDCKKALNETNGDFEAAIDYLRKRGQKISAKRADREATEGVVVAKTNEEGNQGIIIELNCETDFVAKNEDFIAFANEIADLALNELPENLEALMNLVIKGSKVSGLLDDQVAKIGEKIELSSYYNLNAESVIPYIHMGNKIGVLVGFNKKGDNITAVGRDIAMQIAAMNPIALDKDQVPEDVIQKELEIAKEQIKAEGKPEHMLDKIAQGKLNKFFKENTLVQQQFVKDSSKNIQAVLKETDPELVVVKFIRAAIGA